MDPLERAFFDDSRAMQARLSQVTVRQVRRTIESLRNLDLSRVDLAVVRERVFKLLWFYTAETIWVNDGRPIFRGRKNNGDAYFEHVDQLWYPPAPSVTSLGRANCPGSSVFYCCPDDSIPIFELRPEEGDLITILRCKPKSPATPLLISVSVYQAARNVGAKIAGDEPPPEFSLAAWLGHDPRRQAINRLINDFLTQEFKKVVNSGREHDYKITAAASECLYNSEAYGSKVAQGIAYPSVASKFVNANMALLPNAVDALYSPESCKMVRVEKRISDQELMISPASSGEIQPNGRIVWTAPATPRVDRLQGDGE
jgi:hypothetical protein